MNTDLNSATRRWNIDVETEAARLIRLGVPPWDAAIQARQRVEKRRREASAFNMLNRPSSPKKEK